MDSGLARAVPHKTHSHSEVTCEALGGGTSGEGGAVVALCEAVKL